MPYELYATIMCIKWLGWFLLCQFSSQFVSKAPTVHCSSLFYLFKEKLTLTDMGILMTAAVCHDLDHPGYNNT